MRLLTLHNLAYLQRLMASCARDRRGAPGRRPRPRCAAARPRGSWGVGRLQGLRGARLERARGHLRRADGACHRGRDRAAARRRRVGPGALLDVGCGPGELSAAAARAGRGASRASISPKACSPRRAERHPASSSSRRRGGARRSPTGRSTSRSAPSWSTTCPTPSGRRRDGAGGTAGRARRWGREDEVRSWRSRRARPRDLTPAIPSGPTPSATPRRDDLARTLVVGRRHRARAIDASHVDIARRAVGRPSRRHRPATARPSREPASHRERA